MAKDDERIFKRIMGRLSPKEREVLSKYIGKLPARTGHVEEGQPTHVARVQPFKISTAALKRRGPPFDIIRICLDFGTAMSKAWATGRSADETLPLLIGKAAGSEGLTVASSVYISDDGRIYLGPMAERQHRADMRPGRARFDNLKRMLSEAPVGTELRALSLRAGIDPTDSGLTGGDLFVLYLAWLTDLSEIALAEAISATKGAFTSKKIDVRAVSRRFAIPCFEAVDGRDGLERSKWARQVMTDALLRAQILADSLHGHWDDLTISRVVPLIKEVHSLDTSGLSNLMPKESAIREPIAAGASRFDAALGRRSESTSVPIRQLLLVVDAGAGTTDFALFQAVTPVGQSRPRYGLLRRSVKMSRIAGNEIDRILRPIILKACGVDPRKVSPDDLTYAEMDLDSRIRDIKRTLFDQNSVALDLRPHFSGRLALADLLSDAEMKKDGQELMAIRQEIFASLYTQEDLDALRLNSSGNPFQIFVLLTGGSASIPIIRNLATGIVQVGGVNFRCVLVENLPDWIRRLPRNVAQMLASVYPQSAVAIGGSVPVLPDELNDLDLLITPPQKGNRKLQRYQVKGM